MEMIPARMTEATLLCRTDVGDQDCLKALNEGPGDSRRPKCLGVSVCEGDRAGRREHRQLELLDSAIIELSLHLHLGLFFLDAPKTATLTTATYSDKINSASPRRSPDAEVPMRYSLPSSQTNK